MKRAPGAALAVAMALFAATAAVHQRAEPAFAQSRCQSFNKGAFCGVNYDCAMEWDDGLCAVMVGTRLYLPLTATDGCAHNGQMCP